MAQPTQSVAGALLVDAQTSARAKTVERTSDRVVPAEVESLSIELHDRQQIELMLTHRLANGRSAPLDVQLYMFVPRNVGVSAANYPRDEFYGDLTSYVRLDLPDLNLTELAQEGNPHSPLTALMRHIDAYALSEGPSRPLSVQIKLFGHVFTEAVRDRAHAMRSALHVLADASPESRWAFLDEVDLFAMEALSALSALRRALHRFEPLGKAAPQVLEVFRQTDEYSSIYLDGALAKLAQEAQAQSSLFDGSGFVGRLRQTLARHAQVEAAYRASQGYLNLNSGGAEYFAYRQSFLKKAVHQALYVDTRRLTTDTFVRNATGVVAAGLAATWAVVAQMPMGLKNLSPSVQTMLVALPIVAYMAKDRIKELTREALLRRVRAFDLDTAIHSGSLADAGLGELSGRLQERVRFKEIREVPREVMEARLAKRTVRTAEVANEGVLLYTRRLELEPEETHVQDGLALRQIVRLNLRHFLTRLDEPLQEESHYSTDEERFLTAPLPKVYHVNVIARVSNGSGAPWLERVRVVLNKEGIVRLEHVPVTT
jgi:hypothetical protein